MWARDEKYDVCEHSGVSTFYLFTTSPPLPYYSCRTERKYGLVCKREGLLFEKASRFEKLKSKIRGRFSIKTPAFAFSLLFLQLATVALGGALSLAGVPVGLFPTFVILGLGLISLIMLPRGEKLAEFLTKKS
jgi:hypothetical protein